MQHSSAGGGAPPSRHAGAGDRQSYRVTFAVLAFACLVYSILASLAAPALPVLQRDLHTSETGVAWIFTAYLLSSTVATPLVGRLGDIYGKGRMFVAELVVLAFGLLLSSLATSLPLMLAGRVVQGTAGGMFPLAFGVIRDEFPRERVAGGLGMLSAALGVGSGIGVVLAGVIVDHLSYHWLFWIPLFGAVLCAFAAARFVPESPVRAPSRIPWAGALLLSAGLTAVLLAVSQAITWHWGSPRTVGLLVSGAVVLVGWVAVERRAAQPLVDMRVMARPAVWTTNVAAMLIGVGMYSAVLLLPQLVSLPRSTGYGFGASITGAGIFLLPLTGTMLVVSVLAGRLERRFSSKPPLVAGAVSSMAGFVVLAGAGRSEVAVYLASALLGAGIGLAFSAMANLIVDAVPQDQVGVATGINTIARTLGGAVGAQVAGSIIASQLVLATGLPSEHGFVVSFWIVAVALAAATVAAMAVPVRARGRPVVAARPLPAGGSKGSAGAAPAGGPLSPGVPVGTAAALVADASRGTRGPMSGEPRR